ncbi:hypothetical protein OLMES_0505 [Oleiphilus messinensis]|uniref:START domain-containing protein n=1 Tax=Oleiphilus messinensis TaxID=141451 RepID=A0A1Y0I286_9GAMM|nr:hypothetical protein [Oleiphilus messinensis]ARU54608.1 hypothetical protein OLMES_0505 [Oleiphilus messinensis]
MMMHQIYHSLIMLSLSCISITGCSMNKTLPPNTIWELEQIDEAGSPFNWRIYSRTHADVAVKEFKIIGEVPYAPMEAINILREQTENSTAYLPEDQGYIKVIKSRSDMLQIYSVFYMPLFFKSRAMCEHFAIQQDPTSGMAKITWHSDWSLCPDSRRDTIQMTLAEGSWRFEPISVKHSKAIYTVHADLGGAIPAFLNDLLIKSGLPNEFEKLGRKPLHGTSKGL